MKKLPIFVVVLMLCIGSIVRAENSATVQNCQSDPFDFAIGIDFAFGTSKDFQNFVSEQFQVDLPNVRRGGTFAFTMQPQGEKLSIIITGNFRLFQHSKNDITFNWLNGRANLDVAYDVFANQRIRISPFAGMGFSVNELNYNDNRTLGNQLTVSEILDVPSLHLTQTSFGLNAGVKGNLKLYKRFSLSAYIKWEQALSNDSWQYQTKKIQSVPKFNNSGLAMGLMFGF